MALVELAKYVGVLLVLALLGGGLYALAQRRRPVPRQRPGSAEPTEADSDPPVSYAPPEFEWSGTAAGNLPIKILTYKQYECLEDARYGFRIVGLPPSERKLPQPHKTRAHGLKTVASLARHGFIAGDSAGGYVITDHGLHALEACSVRY